MVHRPQRSGPTRRLLAGTGLALLISVGVACGGDNETDMPATTTMVPVTETMVPVTETTMLVKNRPLNRCVTVMSGQRPPPGVTIPRCEPTPTKP